MVSNQSALFDPIRCVIRHSVINDHKKIHQSKETYAVFCNTCRERFSDKDIDLIANLLFTHGGYFGEKKSDNSDLEDLLIELLEDTRGKHKRMSLDDLNIKLFHKVLIHGIPLKSFWKC